MRAERGEANPRQGSLVSAPRKNEDILRSGEEAYLFEDLPREIAIQGHNNKSTAIAP